ncbi:MAG: N-6 DNA methylase, partial [bacterium]|nr:N-6 DNA methylase [bacterium]
REVFKKEEALYHKTIRPQLPKDRKPYMNHLFDDIKKEFKGHPLFDENENIRLKQTSFEAILGELEKFNFFDLQDDVKGISYEELLGKTSRDQLGQFLTPRPIVDFMVDILAPYAGERLCDPCCGSGGFLIKACQFMRATSKPDNTKKRRNPQVLSQYILGSEANPRMARTATLNMIVHGDGHCGIRHHDGLLDTKDIFENSFDVVLANPPFGSRLPLDLTVTENGHKYVGRPIRTLYDLGRITGLSEVLFMERCLRLLRPGGRMGIVLPQSVLNSDRLQRVRDYFEARAKLLLIVSLPNDVFLSSGTPVKTSLVFLKKFSADEVKHYSAILK